MDESIAGLYPFLQAEFEMGSFSEQIIYRNSFKEVAFPGKYLPTTCFKRGENPCSLSVADISKRGCVHKTFLRDSK